MPSVYFPTPESAETVLRAIGEATKGEDVYFTDVYEVKTRAGTYFVEGLEVDRLKKELEYEDMYDGSKDGIIARILSSEKNGPLQVHRMDYLEFVPNDADKFQRTSDAVENLVAGGRLLWSVNPWFPVKSINAEDIHSITELALQSNIDDGMIKTFMDSVSRNRLALDSVFCVNTHGLAGGMAVISPPNNRQMVILSLGANFLKTVSPEDAPSTLGFSLMHENGHLLMNTLIRNSGNPRTIDYVTSHNGQARKLFDELSGKLRAGEIGTLDYKTQEVCDPVLAYYYGSLEYVRYIRDVKDGEMVEFLLEKFRQKDTPFLEGLSIEARSMARHRWILAASLIASQRRIGADQKGLKEFESNLRELARRNGIVDYFDALIKWFTLAQDVMSTAEAFQKFSEIEKAGR